MYAFIPCVSGDDVRDNTPDSDIETTARLSPTVMKTGATSDSCNRTHAVNLNTNAVLHANVCRR